MSSDGLARRFPPLLVVTDRHATRGRHLLDVIRESLAGGARWFQLREKDQGGGELFTVATELVAEIHALGGRLLINDRIDVALAVGADGVVLPAASFPSDVARRLLGPRAILGRSTHSAAEVERAAADGCDFVLFGPLFATPSKEAYGPPRGLAGLREAVNHPIPVVAIGGITHAGAPAALDAGAAGIAVIREVIAADSPREASARLLCATRGALERLPR